MNFMLPALKIPLIVSFLKTDSGHMMKDNLSLCPHFILYLDALVMVNMCHPGGDRTQGGSHQFLSCDRNYSLYVDITTQMRKT